MNTTLLAESQRVLNGLKQTLNNEDASFALSQIQLSHLFRANILIKGLSELAADQNPTAAMVHDLTALTMGPFCEWLGNHLDEDKLPMYMKELDKNVEGLIAPTNISRTAAAGIAVLSGLWYQFMLEPAEHSGMSAKTLRIIREETARQMVDWEEVQTTMLIALAQFEAGFIYNGVKS